MTKCVEYSRHSIWVNGSYSMTENSLKLTNHFKTWLNSRLWITAGGHIWFDKLENHRLHFHRLQSTIQFTQSEMPEVDVAHLPPFEIKETESSMLSERSSSASSRGCCWPARLVNISSRVIGEQQGWSYDSRNSCTLASVCESRSNKKNLDAWRRGIDCILQHRPQSGLENQVNQPDKFVKIWVGGRIGGQMKIAKPFKWFRWLSHLCIEPAINFVNIQPMW